jgi:hypothetical protein
MLSGKNIRTRHPCRKLDYNLDHPFESTEVIIDTVVRLNLQTKLSIHNNFHFSALAPFVRGSREVDLEKVLDAAHPI